MLGRHCTPPRCPATSSAKTILSLAVAPSSHLLRDPPLNSAPPAVPPLLLAVSPLSLTLIELLPLHQTVSPLHL